MNPTKINSHSPRSVASLKKKRSLYGFTLIELLVVIGVIGILVIMVVQALSDAKSTSIDAQVRGSLRSLNQAQTRAFLIGQAGMPTAGNPMWANNPESAVQWYLDNGYLTLNDFDPKLLDYIEIRPLTGAEQDAGFDAVQIWKRK